MSMAPRKSAAPTWVLTGLLALAGAVFSVGLVFFLVSMKGAPDDMSSIDAALAGWKITAAQAAALEQQVARDPGDMTIRETLLGYYFHYDNTAAQQDAQERHVLWVINNAPTSYIAGTPYAEIDADRDPRGYAAGRVAWLSMARQHPRDSKLLSNAGLYCIVWDKSDAQSLLTQAHTLAPGSKEIADHLKLLYSLHGSRLQD